MNALYIVTAYVVLDDTLKALGHHDDCRTKFTTAEILTVSVIAAKYFYNHQERALCILQMLGAVPRLSISRFNRRLHQAFKRLPELLDALAEPRLQQTLYVADTFPLPICHKVRSERCTKVRGKLYLGRCAAKQEWFYGLRLHWLCDAQGFPIAFDLLPAAWHELNAIQYLMADLLPGCWVVADGAYISLDEEALALAYAQVHLVPRYYQQMHRQNTPLERSLLDTGRSLIETAHSLLEKMGVQHLQARTLQGFVGKVLLSLLALVCSHLMPTSN
jgi:hypothetical protein